MRLGLTAAARCSASNRSDASAAATRCVGAMGSAQSARQRSLRGCSMRCQWRRQERQPAAMPPPHAPHRVRWRRCAQRATARQAGRQRATPPSAAGLARARDRLATVAARQLGNMRGLHRCATMTAVVERHRDATAFRGASYWRARRGARQPPLLHRSRPAAASSGTTTRAHRGHSAAPSQLLRPLQLPRLVGLRQAKPSRGAGCCRRLGRRRHRARAGVLRAPSRDVRAASARCLARGARSGSRGPLAARAANEPLRLRCRRAAPVRCPRTSRATMRGS